MINKDTSCLVTAIKYICKRFSMFRGSAENVRTNRAPTRHAIERGNKDKMENHFLEIAIRRELRR